MNLKTKAISEGAMMLALMGIILLVDRQSAGMFELLLFLVSIPVLVYTVRYDIGMASTLGIAAILLGMITGTFSALFYLTGAILMGIIYGYGIRHQWSNLFLLSSVSIGNLLITFITMFLLADLFGFDLEAEVTVMMQMFESVETNIDMRQMVWTSIIFANVAMSILQAMVIHLYAHRLLKRLRLPYRRLKSIYEIHFPKWVFFVTVLVYGLYLGMGMMKVSTIASQIILFLYCGVMLLTLCDGFLTILCYQQLHHKQKGKGSIFLLMIVCLIPGIQTIISVIGLLDIYYDYRKRWKEGVLHEIS